MTMKIQKKIRTQSAKVQASEYTESPDLSSVETEFVDAVPVDDLPVEVGPHNEALEYIQSAIYALAEDATIGGEQAEAAKDAIVNLSVIMMDLQN